MKKGKITVIHGAMKSGKSLMMLYKIDQAKAVGIDTLVFGTPVNTRDGPFVKSRAFEDQIEKPLEYNVKVVDKSEEIKGTVDDYLSNRNPNDRLRLGVFVDEAQFFDDSLYHVVNYFLGKGIDVTCSGLDKDFRGEPFFLNGGGYSIAHFVSLCEPMNDIKVTSLCERLLVEDGEPCGIPGIFTQRYTDNSRTKFSHYSDDVLLPEDPQFNNVYETVCENHHVVPGKPYQDDSKLSLPYNLLLNKDKK
jgi:thymidine kinase